MQDQYQDFRILFNHEFLYQDAEDVRIDHGLNTESELSQVDEASVSVVADLLDGVVEKLSRYFNQLVLHENDTTHLCVRDLQHSTRRELSDRCVLVAEASEKLLEHGGLKSEVKLVRLMEILVDFD